MTLGQRSYELRSSGLKWYEVAAKIYESFKAEQEERVRNRLAHKAKMVARDFAIRNDKPWPVGT